MSNKNSDYRVQDRNDDNYLILSWQPDSARRNAVDFLVAIAGFLYKISEKITANVSGVPGYDDLEFEECIEIIRGYSDIELEFHVNIINSGIRIWRFKNLDSDDGGNLHGIEITIAGDAVFRNESLCSYRHADILWLQTGFEYPSPFPVLALPHDQGKLHPSAFHGFVAIAARLSKLKEAVLKKTDFSGKQADIYKWYAKNPFKEKGRVVYPVENILETGLWGIQPDVKKNGNPHFLWVEMAAREDSDEVKENLESWGDWKTKIEQILDTGTVDLKRIQDTVNQFNSLDTLVKFMSVDNETQTDGTLSSQEGFPLFLSAEKDAVIVGLDIRQSAEILRNALLHGLGHVILGHIRPGDTFEHRDTMDSVSGRGFLRRWDREVLSAFPDWFISSVEKKVESIKDCTAREKACLGLWQMIGEMIGESGSLHEKAEQYQQVMYQRQAAGRLLAQLEEYNGAMLCDGVGLGKTYIATTLIVHYVNAWKDRHKNDIDRTLSDPFKITILAPNSVVSTWRREAIPPLTAFGVPLATIRVISHTKLSRITPNSSILQRISKSSPSDMEHLLLSDLVIVDEAHNFRSISARRTLVLRDLLRLQPQKERNRKVLLLTATPINNSLEDLMQEISLLFSTPLLLSDATTEDGYRRQAVRTVQERCRRAAGGRGTKGDVSPLIIHGDPKARFSAANDFRDDLDFGPNVQRIGDYLKEQDKKLRQVQDEIRLSAEINEPQNEEADTEREPVRIADALLDRIVVQRSRSLCKEIENQHGSDTKMLFRPDAQAPEKLFYSDEYDGISDVLAGFLPLFDFSGEINSDPANRPLSLKIYMWYDVREGIRKPDESSPVVGLQRILVLKRFESSPVSFLITLLRLTVLHALRLQQLYDFCMEAGEYNLGDTIKMELERLVDAQDEENLAKIRTLATGDTLLDSQMDFFKRLGKVSQSAANAADTDDASYQMLLFHEMDETQIAKKDRLMRLWDLKDPLIRDMETLLTVTPHLADIVFGSFSRDQWPHRFIQGGHAADWPMSASWGMRIVTDAKIRQLVAWLLTARREQQKIIVFSQFSDTLAYVYSVLRACEKFTSREWSTVIDSLSEMNLSALQDKELYDLLSCTEVITGETENRDAVVNAFAPFYRINPIPPSVANASREDAERIAEEWEKAWASAMDGPIHVLLSTDILAEGVNLQDVATSVNFDVHWNPVRMIQRAGRIDRRLNQAIEKAESFPQLEKLAKKFKKPVPKYYWHQSSHKAPLTVNMILPDELEKELLLRERIALKTLAIDFTLGLDQGTGAEARWMENYKYQGISSLNAFQKDRPIEQIASRHEKMVHMFEKRGINPGWSQSLNGWFQEAGADSASPLLGRVNTGKKGGDLQVYTRYLQPILEDGIPHWLWSQQKPGDSILNAWLCLDGKSLPTPVRQDIPWKPDASLPLKPEHLLYVTDRFMDKTKQIVELHPQKFARLLQQGISAFSAGFFGSDADRRQLMAIAGFFLVQFITDGK
ncbi:DEAD/DEAH box helicase [Desulfobacterales bacterium HSG16]|nr:DEAD/DEAH box helicase [Desulfobacterales bacterium HSG16]